MTDQVAITGQTNTYRALADGRIRLTVDIDPEYRVAVAQSFGEVGTGVAIALLNQQRDRQQRITQNAKGPYGEQAKELKLSGFFRIPDVWRAIGKDEEFLAWLRTKECAAKELLRPRVPVLVFPSPQVRSIPCDGDIVAAHIRRIANGAGTGIKPPFSALPLCNNHHMLQHQKGEGALGGKEWFDQQRIKYVEQWAWETLKAALGYESFADINPRIIYDWAQPHDLIKYLPSSYK